MRAGAGEDHRMAVRERQGRIVPAATQVIARVVVRGAADPARDRRTVVTVFEDDERLLEVGLVVVRPEER